ncbi:PAS domain S-box protein [Kordia algicida OT-1]|uniref:histidine kinase n=1 Tax=Kordia algicida OT-1 TaxID=391587 RepID=A9DSJ5_9FLAO|nr:PAS domain-containing sensor histidine kinase [Kordia algicida]EDP96943.1 multi-sensor signal transduction histidine kinase [Kordia algicida OT-1]
MSQEQIDILQRALKREKEARRAAEKILEDKSRELYILSEELKVTNSKLEASVSEKTSQLAGVFENIIDAYLVMDLGGNVLKMNDAACELFGYNILEETLNVTSLIYKEDVAYAFESFSELIEKGRFSNYTARVYTKNKGVRWVQINASLIFDANEKPIAAQGIIRDITDQKKFDDKLIESENRLSTLILNLDSAVLLEDENRNIVLTNAKFCEIFKIPVSPELLKGQDCSNAAEESKILFKDPKLFINTINRILHEKKQVIGTELTMADGTILELDFIPILKGGTYKGHLWTYRDISLNRKYSKSLEAQKEKYSSIIANMNLGLVEVDNDDKILMVNQSFCEMSGYDEDELIGQIGGKLFPIAEDENIIERENKKRLNGTSNSYEINVKDKQGTPKNWLISGAPNYNLDGEVIGSIGIHLDITELKNLEKQKEKILEKLEKSNNELYEYAHIVSHDLKSPLRSINALVSWIKMDNEGKFDDPTLQNLKLIEDTLEIMENLISNILEYSSAGSETAASKEVDLNTTMEDLHRLLFVPEHISINILKKLPVVKGDPTKFQQLFQNLMSNAIKFCDKDNGIVEIDVVEEPSFYQFSVRDNGIGIDKKFHDRIFKIFHSLNKSKESTGIGLSIVKKIVDLYEGNIWLESELGEGTTFFFTIKKQ